MALIYADRVQEVSSTSALLDFTLTGAVVGWQSFLIGIGNSNTCYYCATDGSNWEVGLGTFTSGANDVLARTAILASSNAGAKINFPAVPNVFTVVPASIFDGTLKSAINLSELNLTAGATVDDIDIAMASTPADTQLLTAKAVQDYVLDALVPRGALVYLSGQSIASGISEVIDWTSEEYDTDNVHDLVTNKSRLTVPAGITRIKVSTTISWSFHVSGYRSVRILKNGSAAYAGNGHATKAADSLSDSSYCSTAILEVAPNNYFEVQVLQNSGTDISVVGGTDDSWFSMELIS